MVTAALRQTATSSNRGRGLEHFIPSVKVSIAAILFLLTVWNVRHGPLVASPPPVVLPPETLPPPDASDSSSGGATSLSPTSTALVAVTKANISVDRRVWEVPREDPVVDGAVYNASGSGFVSTLNWMGKCWYRVTNFCVVRGDLVLYHDPATSPTARTGSLRMCNEFSQNSNLIRLQYRSEPSPAVLPGPLLTKTQGWVLQFWCQDLFHMTLTLLPAFNLKEALGEHPDIYVRIAKGRRQKSAYCRIKFGHPQTYEVVQNDRWGGDHQFPFAGNPYWPFYKSISPDPWRIHPLYGKATEKVACYTKGVIDKLYVKDMTGRHAANYTATLREIMHVPVPAPRVCGRYRLTFIDRRGKTRRLTNTEKIIAMINAEWKGKVVATPVALETLPISEQLRLMTNTDILMGMHGNGITWLQFIQPGGVVIELIGVWYQPYSKLWGLKHLHSSMKHNMLFKQQGEYVPFPHNETEIAALVASAVGHLDKVVCSKAIVAEPSKQRLDYLYSECVPHC